MQTRTFTTWAGAVSKANRGAVPPAAHGPGSEPQAGAQEAASLLKALANPGRLLLLCQMIGTERSVAELGDLTGIAQPSLSQQLGVLRGERLVSTRREGKHVLYRIDSAAAMAVLQTLSELFCEPVRETSGTGPRASVAPRRFPKVAA